MNKKLLLTLVTGLATTGVMQADLRVTNNSGSIIYLFNESKRAMDRAKFVEIAPSTESYKTMNRDELKSITHIYTKVRLMA